MPLAWVREHHSLHPFPRGNHEFARINGFLLAAATEFMNKKQIQRVYGNEAVPFPDYQLNAHNRRWQRGDW
jgi:hypothetical protein